MLTGSCLCTAVRWTFEGMPEDATSCNCTACRRYGALWIYDWEGQGITVTGETVAFSRGERHLSFNHCPTCGCVTHWRGLRTHPDGRRRIAVNIRMSDPETVAAIPIRTFDGLTSFDDLPLDGRCVRDLWW